MRRTRPLGETDKPKDRLDEVPDVALDSGPDPGSFLPDLLNQIGVWADHRVLPAPARQCRTRGGNHNERHQPHSRP
jgi:hypothetical protein